MSQQSYNFTLITQSGPDAGQSYKIEDFPQTIGRGSGNDIVVADKTLSRQHAKIRATARGCVVEDLGSTNGTYVNGQRITSPTLVRPGDILQVGDMITFRVQSSRPLLDQMETAVGPAAGFGPTPTPSAGSGQGYASPPRQGNNAWLWVGAMVVFVALIIGGALAFLYFYRPLPSTPVAQLPTPISTEAIQPAAPPLPTDTPPPTLPATTETTPLPSPTSRPLQVPGIAAATAIEQPLPSNISTLIDPFCNQTIEIVPDKPALVSWTRRLAASDGQTDYLAQWLESAYYDITLDGRPITDRGAFHYYRDAGPTLNWWINIGQLEPGTHFLRVQWYSNREISNGLDLEPADGQKDLFGPGAAGEGFCEIVVPTPTSLAEATADATATPEPTATPAQAFVSVAPLGVFQDFEQQSNWKRGDQPNGEFSRSTAQVYSGNYAGRLAYDFPSTGNDYVVFLQSRPLAERPNVISTWVYGNNSGHYLNLWIKDNNDQIWQMSFGQIEHTGWQEMIARLEPDQAWPAGHVSGPDNGTIDYPISFQAIVLDDAPDSYIGRGTIYIDDLRSQELVALPTATPTRSIPQIVTTPTPINTGLYTLAVGKHIYEPWGAPGDGDVCESYRNHNFDDRIQMKGFNLELLLTNNSTIPVPDNWSPTFTTSKGKSVQVCYYGYDGSGPQPGATSSLTFFTIVDPDDYVRIVQLEVNGQFIQICLNASGAQSSC